MNTSLERKLLLARAKLGPVGEEDRRPANEDDVVLVSFRVPRAVRDQVHQAAAADGSSSQAWLRTVVQDGVEATLTPQGRLAGELVRNLRSQLLEAVDDGSYQELARSGQDSDLT